MPYNLSLIASHFEDQSPEEVALMLDKTLYYLILGVDHAVNHEHFLDHYESILTLRNVFAAIDQGQYKLSDIWK